jgi:hypothetical protein
MSTLEFLGLVLAWYAVGLVLTAGVIAYDWSQGRDVDGNDVISAMGLALLGPILAALFLVFLLCEVWASVRKRIKFNLNDFRARTLIRGRQKHG